MLAVSKKKLLALSAVAVISSLQVACTDRELAAGAAGAIITAVVLDISSRPSPPPRPSRTCRIQEVEREIVTRGYDGRPRVTRVYERVDTCHQGRYRNLELAKMNGGLDISIADLAATYQLGMDSASRFITALTVAKSSTDEAVVTAALADIGITTNDLRSLVNTGGDAPAEMIDRIAQSLNQDPELTAAMVGKILTTVREQQAARHQGDGTY
ncbi:MAG: hypothetical protein RBT63_01060 [Bdellovibrionales bacterium]|nr:hypothetical protein [Bdellovibrionales bacterium]